MQQQEHLAAESTGAGSRRHGPWSYNYNSMAAAATLSIGLTFLVL